MEVQKEDGSVSEVELRRPNWWLRQAKADRIGNKIYLELHEVNIIGWATIKAIYPNLIDTRLWEGHRKGDYVSRPATGRFVHQTDNVFSYYFSGGDTAIEATPNHPFYSEDRKGWVEVGNLAIGEKVRNKSNKLVTLLRKEQQTQTQKVYNLEIYRNHNYLVGEQGVLVHNTCKFKGFSKGKLQSHFEKHGDEFGDISQNEYLSMAKDFALEEGGDIVEEMVGNFYVKYDKATRRVLVGHAKDREIRTFYVADNRTETPFEDAIELARQLSNK